MRKQTKIVAALSATALLALGASAAVFAAGWDNSTGSWQYLDSNGDPVTDTWKKSGDYWFYLGSDGDMVTSEFVDDDDDTYYVNEDGAMVTNQWVASDEDNDTDADYRWYYFDSNGKALKNNDTEITKSDIETINGKKYLFDEDGKMLYGWLDKNSADVQEDDDQAWMSSDYYYGGWDDGSAQTGWVELTVKNSDDDDKDYWFYFDGNGKKKKDKQTINGGTYYFDHEDGHMISGWVVATGSTYSDVTAGTSANASDNNFIYVNDDGAARKNQWIWTVPSDDWTDDNTTNAVYGKDSEDNEYSWFWAQSSGKFYTGTSTKSIKGKTYIFDEYGRMLSDLVAVTNGKNRRLDPGDYNGDEFADNTASLTLKAKGNGTDNSFGFNNISKLYYFSDDEAKDGSKKSGYVNVEFDDDTYQMYFKNNGEAYGLEQGEYVSKIKKFVSNGVVLKANGEDSNYAGLVKDVDANTTSSIKVTGEIKYGTATEGCVLVNASGTVQKSKKGIKDTNGVYYWTDRNGTVIKASDVKLKTSTKLNTSDGYSADENFTIDSTTYYFVVSD